MTEDRSPTLELRSAAQDNPDAATPPTADTATPASRRHGKEKKPGFFARRTAERAQAKLAKAAAQKAMQEAARNRRRSTRSTVEYTTRTADEIAPVPETLQKAAVWADRTVGAIPLLAPLVVSGWFTAHVFMDPPIKLPWMVAVLVTAALEGGVWKLQRLYEKTLLEGDSTIMLRVGIGLYLGLISGGIYWHAWYTTDQAGGKLGWGWVPAGVTALMSLLGVFISGRNARYQHRVKLRAADKIDRQAPKFSVLSWVLMMPSTFGALRFALRHRIERPSLAFEYYLDWKAAGRPAVWALPVVDDDIEDQVQDEAPKMSPRPPKAPKAPSGRPEQKPAAQPAGAGSAVSTPNQRPGDEPADKPAVADALPGGSGGSGPKTMPPLAGDDILGVASLIMAIVEFYPNWMTDPKLPSERAAVAAINAVRQRSGDSFGSKSRAAAALKAMAQIKARPPRERQQVMDQLGPLAEIPS